MLAREAAANEPAEIERVGGQEVQNAEACLHPNHAAQEPGSGNPRMGEKADASAGANERSGQHESGSAVSEGEPARAMANWPKPWLAFFLAFRDWRTQRVRRWGAGGRREGEG